ncbi:MAG: hypothetical protein ACD_35C00113G0001, partial [uncultured bacterium]
MVLPPHAGMEEKGGGLYVHVTRVKNELVYCI